MAKMESEVDPGGRPDYANRVTPLQGTRWVRAVTLQLRSKGMLPAPIGSSFKLFTALHRESFLRRSTNSTLFNEVLLSMTFNSKCSKD